MILNALHDLFNRLESDEAYGIPARGWSIQKVGFSVVLNRDGSLFDIQLIGSMERNRLRPRPMAVPGVAKPSGSGINPCFLWDNSAYMLGWKRDDKRPERTQECFSAFRERHRAIRNEIGSDSFATVCQFLSAWNPASAVDHEALSVASSAFGVFQIRGERAFVHEDPQVRAWWDQQVTSMCDEGETFECLLTGVQAPVAKTHPKIKGVVGAQSSGAVIVGFNSYAYESYGFVQGENAPVSREAARRYTAALNALLDGPCRAKHCIRLADSTIVFWTDRPTLVEDAFAAFAGASSTKSEDSAQDEGVRRRLEAFLVALREGRSEYKTLGADPEETQFHLLALSPSAARISVRFYLRSSLASMLENLRKHYLDVRLVRNDERARRVPEHIPIWLYLAQCARESKDVPPILEGAFLRSVLTGCAYPTAVYLAVLRRIRADRKIDLVRASLIKGVLVRNYGREDIMVLDVSRVEPAYLLGRLFSALEKTQLDALGDVNASIRDRYYGAASTTPRSVFPRLLRIYQHHLGKLSGGRRVNRERLVQQIVAELSTFPPHLDLENQGLFALGYYHQTSSFYTPRDNTAHNTDADAGRAL